MAIDAELLKVLLTVDDKYTEQLNLMIADMAKRIDREFTSQPCAEAKCGYCGLYGALGQCQGCGAPNRPVQYLDATACGDTQRRLIEIPLGTVIR